MAVDATAERAQMALQEAQRLHGLGEQAMYTRRTRMLDWYLAWHGVVTYTHAAQRSQVSHDITRESIERILPKLLGTYMGFEYFKGGKFSEPATALSKSYLRKMFYQDEMERSNRDKLITGRGVRKWFYHVDKRAGNRRLSTREIMALLQLGVPENKIPKRIPREVTHYEGPMCKAVDVFALTPDPTVDDPRDQYFTFEEFTESPQDMKAKSEGPDPIYDPEAVTTCLEAKELAPGFVQRWRNEVAARKGIDLSISIAKDDPTSKHLIGGYYPFDIDGDGKDESVLIVCDPGFRYLFRLEEHPNDHQRPPYVYDDWMRLTGEFWPIGVAEVLEPVQTMVNTWGNLGIDNIVLAVHNVWLKHADAGIAGNQLKVIPNMMLRTYMMEGLKSLPTEDRTQNILVWLNFWLKRAQEESGITQFNALGTPELGQTKTALGIQTLKAAAEEFLAFAKRRMKERAMAEDAFFCLSLMQQYTDREIDFRLRGEDGLVQPFQVGPDDLLGDFEWDAVVEQQSPLSRELESRSFEEWIAESIKIGGSLNVPAVQVELGKRKGIPRPEQFMQMIPGPMGFPGMQAPGAGNPSTAGGPQPAGGTPPGPAAMMNAAPPGAGG